MLNKIFDMDNVVFRFFKIFGYVWWLHILWLVTSIPVITMGASTTALCYSSMKLRERDENVTKNFFRSFKENFKQSTVIFLIMLLLGAVLIFDIITCSQLDSIPGNVVKCCALALLIPYCMVLFYVFALQAKFVNSVKNTFRNSILVALKNIGYTLCIFIIVATVIILNTTIVLANFVTIAMGEGIVMYVLSAYYNKIFDKIILEERKGACVE